MTPVLMVLGLGVLAAVLIIAIKHRKAAKNVLALVLLIAGLAALPLSMRQKRPIIIVMKYAIMQSN
jgi:hypothetical protein